MTRRPSANVPKFWSFAPPQNGRGVDVYLFTRDGRNSPCVWESITGNPRYYAICATFAAFASLAALVASAAMKRNICCFNCASTSSAIVTTSGSSSSNSKCYWLLCSILKMLT
jgi:hypothetical protein